MSGDFAFKDYYRILGIEREAGDEEIRRAFRKLARETHPDITKNAGNYEAFILVREAYDILTDKKKRLEYDSLWKAYRSLQDGPSVFDMETLAREFDIAGSGAYQDEWEYFKLHPDDYLDLFTSSIKMFTAAALAVLAGAAAPLAVFAGTVSVIVLFALIVGATIGALVTSSLSSVAGIIFALLTYRRLRGVIARLEKRGVSFFGKLVVYPLRGIPKKYGKGVLYMNYAAVFALMGVFGYFVVSWVLHRLPVDELPLERQLWGVTALVLLAVFTVVIIATSLVLVFEIVMEAFTRYPAIRYSRIRVKKRKGIEYSAPARIGSGKGDVE